MKVYTFKNGEKAIYENNTKIIVSDNELKVEENFYWFLQNGDSMKGINKEVIKEIRDNNYTVKTTLTPNGEIVALFSGEIPVAAVLPGYKNYKVEGTKGLKEALVNAFANK